MSITRKKVEAFKAAAARFERPTLAQIQHAAGLRFIDAADILALGAEQGKIRVHDEDRSHIWLEVAR